MATADVKTPFNLPRAFIAAASFLILCVTGLAVGAADPMQQLMLLNGAFSDLTENQRGLAAGSVLGFGVSFTALSGALVGPFMGYFGVKATAILGLALHSLGYLLLFLTSNTIFYYIGAAALGFAFQCLITSHLNCGVLFPTAPNLVLAIIGAGPDLSYFVPRELLAFAEHHGVKKVVVIYLIVFVGVSFLLDLIMLPMTSFGSSVNDKKDLGSDLEHEPLVEAQNQLEQETHDRNKSEPEKSTKVVAKKTNDSTIASPYYSDLSVWQQLKTPDLWFFLPFFVVAFFRKKHMAVSIRSIFRELDSDPMYIESDFYTDLYSTLAPYGFICAILWGGLVDKLGIIALTFAINTVACAYILLSIVPVMALQAVTVGLFLMSQCFVFGHAIAFLASIYGFDTLAVLQGVLSTVAGLFSAISDLCWGYTITHVFCSYRMANVFLLCISVGLYICPLALLFAKRRRAKKQLKNINALKDLNEVSSLLPAGLCYDRDSIQLMKDVFH